MSGLPPPPGTKSRNESMSSSLPHYRTRPGVGANSTASNVASHFANAKSLFESFNTPAIRNGVSQLAKNPLAQKAAISIAKNEQMRTAAINAAHTAATGKNQPPDPLVAKAASHSIKSMVQQFENKPIMSMGAPPTSPNSLAAGRFNAFDPLSYSSTGNYFNIQHQQVVEPTYTSLTAIDPFEFPPQLPSSSLDARSRSSEPFEHGPAAAYERAKPAPSRPPPPRVNSSSSNPSIASSPTRAPTNQAYATAKYPYRGTQLDELNCDPGDTLLLNREANDQWVHASNTRSGQSGLIPTTFLDVVIPLAPRQQQQFASTTPTTSAAAFSPASASFAAAAAPLPAPSATTSSGSTKTAVMRAIHSYKSGVDGDLEFEAGDTIVVYERVNDEWYSGSKKNNFGIFPANFVEPLSAGFDPSRLPLVPAAVASASAVTFTALYDYNSGVADDLAFSAGEIIELDQAEIDANAEWFLGRIGARSGLVPLTFVKRN